MAPEPWHSRKLRLLDELAIATRPEPGTCNVAVSIMVLETHTEFGECEILHLDLKTNFEQASTNRNWISHMFPEAPVHAASSWPGLHVGRSHHHANSGTCHACPGMAPVL